MILDFGAIGKFRVSQFSDAICGVHKISQCNVFVQLLASKETVMIQTEIRQKGEMGS